MSNIARSRAWVEVDLAALRENFLTVRAAAGRGGAVVAMVKADAYGLGMERVVRALEPLQPAAYGVAAAAEGAQLRALGIERPIYVMGPLPPQAVEQAAVARLTASISDLEGLDRWAAAAERLGIVLDFHVEIDTGMGRAGFDWRTVGEWGPEIRARLRGAGGGRGGAGREGAANGGERAGDGEEQASGGERAGGGEERASGGERAGDGEERASGGERAGDGEERASGGERAGGGVTARRDERADGGEVLKWVGVFTHFHGADAPSHAPTERQWDRFQDAVAQLPVAREDLIVHVSNSAAALRWPEYAVDAVRPGIFLYGGHPLAGSGAEGEIAAPRPVAAVRARVVLVREAAPGSTVGYGATHTATQWERWATLAIGYGDGYPRKLGNRGQVLLHGKRVPVVGRISMDMTVVDVSTVPEVRAGDVATLIGRDGDAEIGLDEVAAQAETIGYEILTGLTQRLPRVEVEEPTGREGGQ